MFWFFVSVRPSSSAHLLVYLSAYIFLVLPGIKDLRYFSLDSRLHAALSMGSGFHSVVAVFAG